ncbi:hypothetical protein D3C80_1188640 [compost metagenome]
MHDPRIGRFFATDPLESEFPWNSPYAFSENRVIDGLEFEGLEVVKTTTNNLNSVSKIIKANSGHIFEAVSASRNARAVHWWNHAKGHNNYWRSLKGATGEGIAASIIDANFARFGGSYVFTGGFNPDQTSGSDDGTWDFMINVATVKNMNNYDKKKGQFRPFEINLYDFDGDEVSFPWDGNDIEIQNIGNIKFEIKTFNPKNINANYYGIKKGFEQAIKNRAGGDVSILVLDRQAYLNVINGVSKERRGVLEDLYNTLQDDDKGGIWLINDLHQRANDAAGDIIRDIKNSKDVTD